MSADSYLNLGVSSTKDDVKKAIKSQDRGDFPGAFCKLVPDIAGDSNYSMAIHADGAGTKSSLGYLLYKETNDPLVLGSLAQDSLVMNTDDLACVGITDDFLVSNTIGRNAHLVNGACISAIIDGYDRMIETLTGLGISIKMTGGETADVGDVVRTLIVDSTIIARIAKNQVISAHHIKPGHVIVGLASFGQSLYESKPNSGIASNGLTAARHCLLNKYYKTQYPESISDTIPSELAYRGPFRLEDKLPGSTMTVGESLLSPTRTYLPVVREILHHFRSQISGIIHCTGGGQVKCRDFGSQLHYIKDHLFEMPAIFQAIQKEGNIPMAEMFQIFNCGHRMEFYCEESIAEDIIKIANQFHIEARKIGYVEKSQQPQNQVDIFYQGQHFCY